jgi:hypothetical protein
LLSGKKIQHFLLQDDMDSQNISSEQRVSIIQLSALSVLSLPQPSVMEMDHYEAPSHHSQHRIPALPQLCPAQHKHRQQWQRHQGYAVMSLLKADSPVDLRLQHHISLTAHTRQVRRALVDLQRLAIIYPLCFHLLLLNDQLAAQHRRRPHMQKRIRRNTLGRKHKAI